MCISHSRQLLLHISFHRIASCVFAACIEAKKMAHTVIWEKVDVQIFLHVAGLSEDNFTRIYFNFIIKKYVLKI